MKLLVVCPQGLLDVCIVMIPMTDGDSIPLRSTTPLCAPGCVQVVGFPSAWTSARVG